VLEITESLLIQDADQVARRLSELKELGVRIAVDDFGTGYSSLSYLHDFPLDILKVDKLFIDSVTEGAEESALARAIIKLGHTLSLQVIAEGVEENAQASTLSMLDCDLAQGYLFARPVPAEELAMMIQRPSLIPRTEALAEAGATA
jgi:EAL domain-containing protein (putative c-di-GMP-specific phosphodiesterase class I)